MSVLTPSTSLPAAFENPSGSLLRPTQMVEHEYEIKVAKDQLQDPRTQDKGAARKRVHELTRQYETQAPRPVDGETKDSMKKEADTLLADIQGVMLSQEEMRKNPPGSVDRYRRGEGSKAYKQKILRWKKLQLMLNADQSHPSQWDRDAANIERFRPSGAMDRFRADAQITGKMSYGNVPEENWALAFGETNPPTSALNQAIKAQTASPEVVPSDEKPTKSAPKKVS